MIDRDKQREARDKAVEKYIKEIEDADLELAVCYGWAERGDYERAKAEKLLRAAKLLNGKLNKCGVRCTPAEKIIKDYEGSSK